MMIGEWLSERQRLEHNEQSRNNRKNVNGANWFCSCNVRNNICSPHARCIRRYTDLSWRSCVNVGRATTINHVWCHGPSCHTQSTQDRVRGSKGSKVLRTRKIKVYDGIQLGTSLYHYFCSQSCYNEFANIYVEQIVRIAPRTEPLETPIEDPKKVTHEGNYVYPDGTRHTWTETEIKKIDRESNVG